MARVSLELLVSPIGLTLDIRTQQPDRQGPLRPASPDDQIPRRTSSGCPTHWHRRPRTKHGTEPAAQGPAARLRPRWLERWSSNKTKALRWKQIAPRQQERHGSLHEPFGGLAAKQH